MGNQHTLERRPADQEQVSMYLPGVPGPERRPPATLRDAPTADAGFGLQRDLSSVRVREPGRAGSPIPAVTDTAGSLGSAPTLSFTRGGIWQSLGTFFTRLGDTGAIGA